MAKDYESRVGEMAKTVAESVKAAVTPKRGSPAKKVPREPTAAMAAAMMAAPMPITLNDKAGWQTVWEAGFDAAPGEPE
jgi:hypothetical protein